MSSAPEVEHRRVHVHELLVALERTQGMRRKQVARQVGHPAIPASRSAAISTSRQSAFTSVLQYHLYVLQRIQRGREDAQTGRLVPQDQVEQRLARWLDE